MSRVTRNKHVMREMFADDFKHPTGRQQIVRVVNTFGNNLHEVITPNDKIFLVSMPKKFRNNIYIKRKDFVVIEPIDEGDKVKGEIVKILNQDYIKQYYADGIWPTEYVKYLSDRITQRASNNTAAITKVNSVDVDDDDDDADDEEELIICNPNRHLKHEIEGDDDDDSDEDDDEEEDEDEHENAEIDSDIKKKEQVIVK